MSTDDFEVDLPSIRPGGLQHDEERHEDSRAERDSSGVLEIRRPGHVSGDEARLHSQRRFLFGVVFFAFEAALRLGGVVGFRRGFAGLVAVGPVPLGPKAPEKS